MGSRLIPKKPETVKFIELKKSAGILDDYAVRKSVQTKELYSNNGIINGNLTINSQGVDPAGLTINATTGNQAILWLMENGVKKSSWFYVPSTNVIGFGSYSGGAWAGYNLQIDQDDKKVTFYGNQYMANSNNIIMNGGSIDLAETATECQLYSTGWGNFTIGGSLEEVTLDYSGITSSRTYTFPDAAGTFALTSDLKNTACISFVIDGGGSAITTGVKGDLVVPFACTINSCTLLADQTGSIKIDIWKDTYSNYPPTNADTITAANEPEISSGTKDQDTTLTSWTKTITAGQTLRFNVDSCTTITRCTIALEVTKT